MFLYALLVQKSIFLKKKSEQLLSFMLFGFRLYTFTVRYLINEISSPMRREQTPLFMGLIRLFNAMGWAFEHQDTSASDFDSILHQANSLQAFRLSGS